MENEIPHAVDWIGVLLNLTFFFGFVTVIFYPILKFRLLAKRYGQKRWLFSITGFAVGFLGLGLGRLFMLWLSTLVEPGYHSYLVASLFFIPPIIIYLIVYNLFKKSFTR
jgi:hypothetical protein